jgi:hypothetical protein
VGTVQAPTLGASLRVAEYSLLSPIRDFRGDSPDHCRLFFRFARNLIDRKHLYVLQQNIGLAIGVQQIRGIRSTEPMSAAGMTPPLRLNGLTALSFFRALLCRLRRFPSLLRDERLWHRTARLPRR